MHKTSGCCEENLNLNFQVDWFSKELCFLEYCKENFYSKDAFLIREEPPNSKAFMKCALISGCIWMQEEASNKCWD